MQPAFGSLATKLQVFIINRFKLWHDFNLWRFELPDSKAIAGEFFSTMDALYFTHPYSQLWPQFGFGFYIVMTFIDLEVEELQRSDPTTHILLRYLQTPKAQPLQSNPRQWIRDFNSTCGHILDSVAPRRVRKPRAKPHLWLTDHIHALQQPWWKAKRKQKRRVTSFIFWKSSGALQVFSKSCKSKLTFYYHL